MKKNVGIAYIPVIHKGYIDFCNTLQASDVSTLFLVSEEILRDFESLDYIYRKDVLRAVDISDIEKAVIDITGLDVQILTKENVGSLLEMGDIFLPREDVSSVLADTYFNECNVVFVDIFLRWNKENIGEDKIPESTRTVSPTDFQKELLMSLEQEAHKSFDWWRQVGAALIKNDEVITVTHNEHMPVSQLPNIIGDTRSLFKRGININYVTSAHAEVVALGTAAKNGIATLGADLYVTDFPCPYCARLIAQSGIKRLFFKKGYAVLEGDDFLKQAGVEIIHIAA